MNIEALIEAAKTEARAKGGYTAALETAIREGLVDGDRIHLGGNITAEIKDGVCTANGKSVAIAAMPAPMHERMLVLKGVQAGMIRTAMGSIKA